MVTTSRPKRGSTADVEPTPQVPQSSPVMSYSASGGLDAGFVWQQLSEIQKSLGAIQATLQQHGTAIERLDERQSAALSKLDEKLSTKLGKIDADVSEFKQIRHTAKVVAWIVGIAGGAVIGVAGLIVKEAWSVFKPIAIQQQQAPSTPIAPHPVQPLKPSQPTPTQ